jgi:hypothetical protein
MEKNVAKFSSLIVYGGAASSDVLNDVGVRCPSFIKLAMLPTFIVNISGLLQIIVK